MGLMDRAKEAAEQARQTAAGAVDQARPGSPSKESDEATSPGVAHPAALAPGASGIDDVVAQMKKAARRSKTSLATLVERIDPGILADLIVKATAAQEKANIALRERRSPYRIAEINITATIPPQIGFSVQRMGDMDELDDPASLELLEEGVVEADVPVVSLDGEHPIEEIGHDED